MISEANYKYLNSSNSILPRVYGVYKPDCSLHIIVFSIGSSLHNLATFLHNILKNSLPPANSHIGNSFQLIKNIKKSQN